MYLKRAKIVFALFSKECTFPEGLKQNSTWSIAFTISVRFFLRNRGCASATSMNSSSASCAKPSSPACSVFQMTVSCCGMVDWNLSLSAGSSSS